MDVLITPRPLSGTVTVPASKSDIHRALICAAFADAPTIIRSVKTELISVSHDIRATADALIALGAQIAFADEAITVHPVDWTALPLESASFDCASSGSTARFMLPLAAVLCRSAYFTGSEQLRRRPLDDLMVAMYEHGARFVSPDAATAGPLTMGGSAATLRHRTLPLRVIGGLEPGDYDIPGDVSSQYVTGLLFAMALMSQLTGEGSTLTLTSPLESAGYVDMTIESLARFGICVEAEPGGWSVAGGQRFVSPGTLTTEGDWSNGAILLTLAAMNPGTKVKGLKASSLQPDRFIEQVLPLWRNGRIDYTFDVRDVPDLFPLLAVMAATPVVCAPGQKPPAITFIGIDRLRYKESNRIDTTARILTAMGYEVEVSKERCTVHPKAAKTTGANEGLTPGTTPAALGLGLSARSRHRKPVEVDCAEDHRIVMAATVAAHALNLPVLLRGAEAIEKSYPIFFDDYRHLGGSAEVCG